MEFFELDYAYGSQCGAADLHRHTYPKMGVTAVRCGGSATRGVTWQGRVEGTHTLLVCDGHALKMAAQAIEGSY